MAGKGFGAGISADLASPGARFDQLSFTDPFKCFQPSTSVDAPLSNVKKADLDVTVGKDKFGEFDPLVPKKPTIYDNLKSGASKVGDYIMPDKKSFVDVLKEKNIDPLKATEAQIKVAKEIASKEGPGFLRRFGPTAGLVGLGLYAGGAFDEPEQKKLNIPISGMELFKQNPDLYRVANMTPRRATRKDETEKERDFIYEPYKFKDPSVFYARQGGLAALGSTINQKLQEPAGLKAQEIPNFLKEVETMTEAKFGIDIPSLGERPLGLGMPQIPREITNPSLGGIRMGSSGPATTILEGLPSNFGDVFQAYMPMDQGEGIDQFGKPMPTNEQTGPAMTDEERLNMLNSAFGQGVSQSGTGAFGGGSARQSGLQNFITGIGALGLAEGGDVFPRRNGGIGPNEGTPGKDSVRAMLMPGEFVMTTDAVRGLGNGDLNTGIKNMYSVMSKLEKKGKAMA